MRTRPPPRLAVGTREKLERLPVGWWHLWRLGEALGAAPKYPVIFECVGVPGVIESVDLRFAFGYTPLEFRDTLHMLAEGKVDPGPLITGTVGLDGVGAAFAALGDPEIHAKILIDPRSDATAPALPWSAARRG